jgi:DNA-binding NarL/FixJ family response regulator
MAHALAENLEFMTRIAIVEDNETMRQTLMKFIGDAPGCKCVCVCASAEEALEKLPAAKPNVVLMDIHMPGQTGIACTARLTVALPKVQVIMLTVYKDIQLIFQALQAGACGYLLKRSSREEILDAIAEVRSGGAPMTSEIARLVVRSFKSPATAPVGEKENLSAREFEILGLIAKGLSNKEIGSQLNISPSTVSRHLVHIYAKLHVRCRTEAAAVYLADRRPAGAASPV